VFLIASSSVSFTSSAVIDVVSFQAMMYREKSSKTVDCLASTECGPTELKS